MTVAYKLKLDKISITVPITETHVQAAIVQAINDMNNAGPPYLWGSGGGYTRGVRIFLDPEDGFKRGTFLHLQARPWGANKRFMRLEWNPANMGELGLASLQQDFNQFLPDWRERIQKDGKVTRVDIACDFIGVKVDDVVVWSKWAKKLAMYTNAQGETETIYLGAKESNQTVVYDRVAKIKQDNKTAKYDIEVQSVPKKPVTRLERRLRTDIAVTDLLDMGNPLDGISVYAPKPQDFPNSLYRFPAFRNMAQMRGYKRAVAALPPVYRAKYEKKFLASPAPWWDADSVWKHWPRALKIAGLLTS